MVELRFQIPDLKYDGSGALIWDLRCESEIYHRDVVLTSFRSDLEITAALVVSTITIELDCLACTFT